MTLRIVGGLTTTEIARAFLVPEATMAQRFVRAKRKIKAANIPYRVPPEHLWPERFTSVLSVIYLIFNEGYAASSGDQPTRAGLCEEAIRLGRILVELVPNEPEALGLQALMLLHNSRHRARADDLGNLVTLDQQDRNLWNQKQIETGVRLLRRSNELRQIGAYQLQAAISSVHARAGSHEETDWQQIVSLYQKLHDLHPSPVIALNKAVAMSFAESPESGLTALSELNDQRRLDCYQPYHAARADLLRRAGKGRDAASAYRQALRHTSNEAEQRFLESRLKEVLQQVPEG